jgi:hypothetical protein
MTAKAKSEESFEHLPCAGITLFRFYGYYLSRQPNWKHPGNLINCCKIKIKVNPHVTFYDPASSQKCPRTRLH